MGSIGGGGGGGVLSEQSVVVVVHGGARPFVNQWRKIIKAQKF